MAKKHMNTGFEGKKGLAVDVRGGNFDAALRLFTRKIKREGLMREVRDNTFYEKPSTVRRRKHAEAVSRWRKTLRANGDV